MTHTQKYMKGLMDRYALPPKAKVTRRERKRGPSYLAARSKAAASSQTAPGT